MVGITPIGSGSNLNALNQNLNKILQLTTKLSTGQQINRASDNPAGLVISERLGAQLATLNQGIQNSQRVNNELNVADGGLSQISNSLIKAKELSIAAQDSTLSSGERDALQMELDAVLGSIDRIAGTTNFAGQQLLDGNLEPRVTNTSSGISDVRVDQVGNPANLPSVNNVDVTAVATRGALTGTVADITADTQVVITGSKGSEVFNFTAGTSAADVETAINAASERTGVESVGGVIRAQDVGSQNSVRLEGTLDGVTEGYVTGTDIQGTVNGQAASGLGNTLTINSSDLNASITFEQGAGTGNFSFTVESEGLGTNLGDGRNTGIGIQRVGTDNLGTNSGLGGLNTLFTGGANSLSNNPVAASSIIDSAISEVSSQRARIGAFQSNVLGSTENSLSVAAENVAAARSRILDTDFASTIAELTSTQIKQQAQISLQAQLNLTNQNILGLLMPT